MSLQDVSQCANGITQACGLDANQAKTVVYWAVATHAIDKLNIMPILAIFGGHGSGKSSLIACLQQMVYNPRHVDGKVSRAELRDSLKLNSTALIEEGDETDERQILKRYSRQTSSTSVKRGGASTGWSSQQVDLFGATALHRRVPFADPAVDSRSITIRTAHRQGNFSVPTLDPAPLSAVAQRVDWSKTLYIPDGRAKDTWMPLFQAALACNDTDWMAYALVELNKAIQSLNQGQGYEPRELVFCKLVSLAIDRTDPQAPKLKDRVSLKAMSKGLKEDGESLNSWQIGKLLRGLGLDVRTSGGIEYVHFDKAKLLAIAADLGIDDPELKRAV
jgi:energy-coupling factor transporter ATP-binding protein EcfA2